MAMTSAALNSNRECVHKHVHNVVYRGVVQAQLKPCPHWRL